MLYFCIIVRVKYIFFLLDNLMFIVLLILLLLKKKKTFAKQTFACIVVSSSKMHSHISHNRKWRTIKKAKCSRIPNRLPVSPSILCSVLFCSVQLNSRPSFVQNQAMMLNTKERKKPWGIIRQTQTHDQRIY